MTQTSNTSAAPFGSNTFRCPEAHDHCPCRKGEQTLAGFLQAIGDSAVLEPPLAEEGLATDFPIPIFRNEINALGDFKGGVKVARDFAYHVICQMIYSNEGPVAHNERYLAGELSPKVGDGLIF